MSPEEIELRFTHHSATAEQVSRMTEIREAAKNFVTLLVDLTPTCAEQTRAVNRIEGAVMLLNTAIVRREAKPE